MFHWQDRHAWKWFPTLRCRKILMTPIDGVGEPTVRVDDSLRSYIPLNRFELAVSPSSVLTGHTGWIKFSEEILQSWSRTESIVDKIYQRHLGSLFIFWYLHTFTRKQDPEWWWTAFYRWHHSRMYFMHRFIYPTTFSKSGSCYSESLGKWRCYDRPFLTRSDTPLSLYG